MGGLLSQEWLDADHVHPVVSLPSTLSIADLAKQVKGASSYFVNEVLRPPTRFRWQGGYGAFAVSRWDLPEVIGYARRQKEHHAMDRLWQVLEEVDLQRPTH